MQIEKTLMFSSIQIEREKQKKLCDDIGIVGSGYDNKDWASKVSKRVQKHPFFKNNH